jgi:hypothetical protein
MTLQIADSQTEQAKDRIEAMRFLRQLFVDQYSLFLYGPSQSLTRDISGAGSFGSQRTAADPREETEDDSNAVF